jgi:Ca-activated chloride channel family protein
MELLAPASLAWLGLLAPLILLYVLKRRRETRIVGSTMLWDLALRDMRAERPWKRLIPHLSLLLQALILIAGALALARPAGAGQVPSGARIAVVVDTSASMAAIDRDGRARIDAARAAASAIARTLPPGSEMMLIEAAREPAVLVPSTTDTAALERAIERLRTRGSGSALEGAIAIAAERMQGAPPGSRIVVLTDGAQDGEVVLPTGVEIDVQRIGSAPDASADERGNHAIVAVDVAPRPTDDAPDRAEIFVRVARFGGGRADSAIWVTASIDGRGVVASRRARLGPDRSESVVMSADLPPDADGRAPIVSIELSSGDDAAGPAARRDVGSLDALALDALSLDAVSLDALALDDRAVAASPGARRLPVFLIGAPPAALRRALLADRDVELFATTLDALAARRQSDPAAPDLDGLLVHSGATPESAPAGDVLAVAPTGAQVLGLPLDAEVARPSIVTWDEGDPRLRFVPLRDLHVAAARPITGSAARPLITSSAGTIAAVLERPDGEATILAFDPDRSDWPRRPGFVVFVRNLLERVRARRAAGGIAPGALGDPLRIPAVDGEVVTVRAPDGTSTTATARGGVAIVPTAALPGVYVAEIGRRRAHALRNLLSPEESDLRARVRFVAGDGAAVRTRERREPAEAWPWLAAAVALLLALEVAWATRRRAA